MQRWVPAVVASLVGWRLALNDAAPQALLVGIGLAFLAAAVSQYVAHQSTKPEPKAAASAVIGVALLLMALQWQALQWQWLAASLTRLASDARLWLSLLLLAWIYFAASSIILLRQRYQLGEVIEKDIIPFRLALQRFVLPRRLMPEQIESIGAYLGRFSPYTVDFVVVQHDEEAGQFRADIHRAIEHGGWTTNRIDYQSDIDAGFGYNYTQTTVSSQQREDPRNPRPDRILSEAFTQAGVPFDHGGGGSGITVTQNTLTIQVGRRRRDTHARPQPWRADD